MVITFQYFALFWMSAITLALVALWCKIRSKPLFPEDKEKPKIKKYLSPSGGMFSVKTKMKPKVNDDDRAVFMDRNGEF